MLDKACNADESSGAWQSSQAVVELLRDAKSYPDRPSSVECIETHISWVFLTDRYAYKLKKPVRFDFLDFSTPQLRHQACISEVQLNRRLAGDVYLDVLPISHDHQRRPRLGGRGDVLDWVVKMRRLPKNGALDRLIGSGALTRGQIDRLAQTLTDFYQRIAPVTIRVDEYAQRIERHIDENQEALLQAGHFLETKMIHRVTAGQRCFVRLFGEMLADRVRDGRLVEGHGDLRPEHVYLNGKPRIIDCIEFNAELRQLDVLDELGFFAMECDMLAAPSLGEQIVQSYCRASGDKLVSQLWFFYKSYRACVRAKVMALRAQQLEVQERTAMFGEARRYLLLADQYTREFARGLLIVVRGTMGTGKSTLAYSLAEHLGIDRLQTDAIRRQMYGGASHAAAYDEGRYRPENRARVYQQMFDEADRLLAEGRSVVLDGTFLSTRLCRQAVVLAGRHEALPLLVHCRCPDDLARQRIADRLADGDSLSEARPELHARQLAEEEPLPADLPVLTVDTSENLLVTLDRVLSRLRGALAGEGAEPDSRRETLSCTP